LWSRQALLPTIEASTAHNRTLPKDSLFVCVQATGRETGNRLNFVYYSVFKTGQVRDQRLPFPFDGESGAISHMHEVEHISIYIDRPPDEVYEFASNPENLPRWAAGLASSEIYREDDAWVAEAPFGKVRITFAEKNSFGVMDHDVELESCVVVHNPMRVVANGAGSEFTFTLLRQSGMSDEQFTEDKQSIEKDLATLKEILESCC
jgi:carbon monoxide dehydrogenase subunit G